MQLLERADREAEAKRRALAFDRFRHEVAAVCFDEAAADGMIGTDEASLVERSGHPVAVVMGAMRNIKITTPADLELAEFFLKR